MRTEPKCSHGSVLLMQDCDAPVDAVNTSMTSIERAIAAAGMGYALSSVQTWPPPRCHCGKVHRLTICKLLSLLKGNMLAQLTNVTAAKYGPKKPEIMRPCKIWEFVDGNHAGIFRRYRGVNAALRNTIPISV